ncbi:hypothetical protein [uncultured Ruegeria sp.]|uniref:hypothetical protein n=1 Tax=uncultured Ruegeria sp. TaxID=259304 RepID=UPI00260E51B3|nr:hypothetical protein [uncultured Ruegeria sp.]
MTDVQFELFADYFQFYVQDEQSDGIDGDSWTDVAINSRLALEANAFAVSTARNMEVPVRIVVSDRSPDLDLSLWNHVVEFSIGVPSGRLVFAGCTDYYPDAERLAIESGCYEVRVLYANLDKLSDDGLDGNDHYRVELWKGHSRKLKVVKQHPV